MPTRSQISTTLTLGLFLTLCGPRAACSFEESFDNESGAGDGASGLSGLNYTSFANWNVITGTVDLIANGDFNISCTNGLGKCVDLDGGSRDAGVLVSQPQTLLPGFYRFSFELGGVANIFGGSAAAAPNFVNVSIGGFFSEQFVRQQGDPFETFGGEFVVTEASTVSIAFENLGGDNFGAMLDNVALTRVPEPTSLGMASLGLISLALACRRHRG